MDASLHFLTHSTRSIGRTRANPNFSQWAIMNGCTGIVVVPLDTSDTAGEWEDTHTRLARSFEAPDCCQRPKHSVDSPPGKKFTFVFRFSLLMTLILTFISVRLLPWVVSRPRCYQSLLKRAN